MNETPEAARSDEAPAAGLSSDAQPSVGAPPRHEDFSLVLGGPIYQLLLRAQLTRPTMELVKRRIVAAVALTWLPPALLSLAAGTAMSGVAVPFLYDISVHARFLVVLPALIGAELIVHRRLRGVVEQFIERGIVAPEDRGRFAEIVDRSMQLRNSILVEVALLVATFAMHLLWLSEGKIGGATWYGTSEGGSIAYSAAGSWFVFFSLPALRFILLRWYFRIFIWYLFLWRVSKLRLRLDALHPDKMGGIGFLSGTADVFAPLAMAQSAFVAGIVADRIVHGDAKLPQFQLELAAFGVFLILLVLLPLMFFGPQLVQARRAALRSFGAFAARYTEAFGKKWLRGPAPPDEPLLGTADLQSLADLGNHYAVVREMSTLPFSRQAVVRLATLIVVPALPLALTMIPVDEIVTRLLGMLL